jgi:hypothetical protein
VNPRFDNAVKMLLIHVQIEPETHSASPSLIEFRKSRFAGIGGVLRAAVNSNSAHETPSADRRYPGSQKQ